MLTGGDSSNKGCFGRKQIYSGNLEILPGIGKPGKFFGKYEIFSGHWAKIWYIEDITRWREDMNFMFEWQEHKIHIFEPTCNVLFIIWRNQFNKSKRRESWRHWTIRHSQRWHTENTPLGSRMKWRMESTSGLVPSKTLSSI